MANPTSWVSKGPKFMSPLASTDNLARLLPRMFDMAYPQLTFVDATHVHGEYATPGLVVALNSVTNKYVPWVTDASHGAGSDTAVGILVELLEITTWDRACTPVYHGEMVEQYCYTEAGAIGTIPAGVKTDLPDIQWK